MRSQILAELLHHEGFVIGPVADVHFGDGVAFEDDDLGADKECVFSKGQFFS